jgi:DNA mismatch repair protein MutL
MIHVLDPVTIGQIAAGEIVERPLSVVKELVENAVDAGATRASINIENGGLDLVEVIDDGTGMPPHDLPLAVRRHATSKLTQARDLESIATLGFRGEGLASIAAVSQVEIVTRGPDAPIGSRISAYAEEAGVVEPAAAPLGTRVRAQALFENVPVRREFLKSASAEFNRISSWLAAFALAYPAVTFVLRHNGKDVWTMPATGDVRQRLAMVFGRAAAESLIELNAGAASSFSGTLRGFISTPGTDRPDRRRQLLFVNRRLLRSPLLAGAWTAGYATFAMVGRHPYGVLFLDVPPEHVDANVHPTKSDVRLRYAAQTFDTVRRAITRTLHDHATRRFQAGVGGDVSFAPFGLDAAVAREQELFEALPDDGGASTVPHLRVLAQLHNTFVLASDGDSLLLVDQHAAHERIAYEEIVRRARSQTPSEPLLVPIVIELDPEQSLSLDRMLDLLREGGVEIEPFGERTYRITATPAGYSARAFDLRGFLDDLSDEPKQRDVRERIWASLACHSVTVAGERLEPDEMTTLIERLQQCDNPMHCPHGRPTLVRLSPADLAKMFKRI